MAVAISDIVRIFSEVPLLEPSQQAELERLQQRSADPKALMQTLVQRGWLTSFQANCILKGQAASLRLGPFVILDRLGEGGMGQVFKARHAGLGRVVALKVLRPELVPDSESVSRFYREITLAGQLPEHPNLIRAYDAGLFGSTHFLAMEFVAGTDLEQLVKKSGPLPVEQASDYIRQAALGLQHAHQHGLVHRDIKPSNLLVTSGKGPGASEEKSKTSSLAPSHQPLATLKVLDLGLARLRSSSASTVREQTFLTSDGPVTLGTVDYQAPEQALDFHQADIRADIYSLGCTFFYLLTGKPPFGSGPLALKLMRHQQADPPRLKERRPDVPDGVIRIIERMLAKKPADRYQTPGEVAAALDALHRPPRRPSRRAVLAGAGLGTLLFLLLVSFVLVRGAGSTTSSSKALVEQPKQPPPPAPGSVEATVPEARDYQLVYDLNLAKLARDIVYDDDQSAKITRPFDRIAYFIELKRNGGERQYLYVSMIAFTSDIKKVGVPAFTTGATFQQNVSDMNVFSNVAGIVTGTAITGGNIEFWPNNYNPVNSKKVPNADSGKYDWGDNITDPVDGYGSMQVHNHIAKQTLFAINHWRQGKKADIGIGNNPNPNGNPDWTFIGNAETYVEKRLRVLVRLR
jgi:serine/threonine protein kinase